MTTATTKSFPGSRSLENVSVEEAMHRGVLSCPFDTPLAEVARMMATHRIHAVVGLGDIAGDDIRVWGVVSDRDLVAMAAAGGDVAAQTAGSSAATEVLTIDRRDSLRHAAQRMHEHGLSHLLVLEPGSDRPLGVISSLDVAAALAGHEHKRPPVGTSVADLMTARVVTVPPDLSLKQAAAIMVEKGISGVPVVRDGTVVGVLSEADIVAEERGTPAVGRRSLGWIVRKEGDAVATRLTALTAGDAMTAPAVTIESWRPAASAAAVLTKRGVKRLPVLDNGRLVGIVTRSDLVRAFARPDEEIEREIRERVVVREFWQSPEDVAVSVHGGRVRLSGTVDDRVVADGLPDEVQRVPGVIAVDSTLASPRREPLRFRLLRS